MYASTLAHTIYSITTFNKNVYAHYCLLSFPISSRKNEMYQSFFLCFN